MARSWRDVLDMLSPAMEEALPAAAVAASPLGRVFSGPIGMALNMGGAESQDMHAWRRAGSPKDWQGPEMQRLIDQAQPFELKPELMLAGHERSRTGSTPSGAVNVYGKDADTVSRRGTPLDPVFSFEKNHYPSVREAVGAASRRSQLGDVAGWRNTSSDLLRSNPQIGAPGLPAQINTSSPPPLNSRNLSPTEISSLRQAADKSGVDAGLLRALAIVENGPQVQGLEGPTRGLGIISVPAPTFDDQAYKAAQTVSNTLTRYRKAYNREPMQEGKYTEDFLSYLSRGGPGYPGYAPLKAQNDPTNLNANHLKRLLQSYRPESGVKNLPELMPRVLGAPR